MTVQREAVQFTGGLDLNTPYLAMPPGRMIAGSNYEQLPLGGYRRIDGYVLFDGQLEDPQPVPGTGPINGVWIFNDDVYAFRDHDETTAKMWRSTELGWDEVDLGTSLRFSAGNRQFAEGDEINGQTSGATATVKRLVIVDGVTGDSSLVGTLALADVVGTFTEGENIRISTTVHAVADADSESNTLPSGGRYEFVNANFFGQVQTRRMYGVNKVGYPFEWDGETFVSIENGVDVQFPDFIATHRQRLIVGYPGGSILISGLGTPHDYRAISDATEIAIGDAINGFLPLQGGVLGIACRESFQILYGDDTQTFEVRQFSSFGMRPYTLGEVSRMFMALDERGVIALTATQGFGDFTGTVISDQIKPEVAPTNREIEVSASITARVKGQYRLFFGTRGFYFTVNNGQLAGITRVDLDDPVRVTCSVEDATGRERMAFGSDDGKVFLMDIGSNFNGAPILAFCRLAFNFQQAPTIVKQLRRMFIDAQADTDQPVQMQARVDFDDGREGSVSSRVAQETVAVSAGQGFWNFNDWNTFNWSVPYRTQVPLDVRGYGENMSLSLVSTGAEDGSHTLFGAVIHYSLRRPLR